MATPQTPRTPQNSAVVVRIENDADIIAARRIGRDLAGQAGCVGSELTEVAAAISEIARNMLTYAGGGEVTVRLVERLERCGVEVTASDHGPGILSLDRALEDGFTTGSGLGLGLPGARRLMDEFEITTAAGQGTTVVMRKWCTVSVALSRQRLDGRDRGVA
jgi:serine/threonine-protein kinase RsbT